MAQDLHFVQYTLNNGEVSYRYESRGDHPKYAASCYKMENFFPLTVGGARYRNGSRWVATLAAQSRPIAFVFNKLESYVLVFSDLSLAIYHSDGSPVTVTPTLTTVWQASILSRLYVFQSADVMYICSGAFAVYKLSRITAESFELTEVFFYAPGTVLDEPTGEELQTGTTLTPSATTGNGVTFTLSNAVAVAADIGRIIVYKASRAVITAQGGTTYTADIISPFPNTNAIPSIDWRLTGAPDGTANTQNKKVKGNRIVIDFSVANAIRIIDIGKYIAIDGGFVRITKRINPTQIEGTIVSELKDVAPGVASVATPIWTVWRPAWTAEFGYPTCGTFFQGRMYLCRDITVWASIVNDIENFALGSGDDDGVNKSVTDDEVNDIRWIASTNRLYFGTIGGVYVAIASSDGGPLTTNDFNIQHVSGEGAEQIKPARAHGQIINIQYGARQVRELAFDFIDNQTKSPNLIALADHMTEDNQILGLTYQQDPHSLLLAPLDSGQIAVMAYNREELLAGWCRFVTPDGCFMDVCSVPNVDGPNDRVFSVVQRGDIWTLEYFDTDTELYGRQWKGLYTDGAVVFVGSIAPDFIIAGLDHLEGLTVTPIGDGLIYDEVVVTNGEIDVTPQIDANEWEVGIQYPGRIQPLEPQIPNQFGAPWTIRGWAEVGARIRQTLGIELGVVVREEEQQISQNINFRKQSHDPLTQLPPQRGKVCVAAQGHDGVNRMVLLQNRPLPAEILGLFGLLEVGDRPKCETFDEPEAEFCLVTPPPPPVIQCPDEPTASHIHDGFTVISNDSVVVYRATAPNHNYAVYRGSTGASPFLTVFDMDDMAVLADGFNNGYYINADPAIDHANGAIYAFRRTLVGSNVRLAIWDKDDLTLVSEGPDFSSAGQSITDTKVGTNFIFAATSLGKVFIFDKATKTLQVTVTPADANHNIESLTVDNNDNAWGMTRQKGGFATANLLMKITSGGAVTDYDVTADMGAPTLGPMVMFDSFLNAIFMRNDGAGIFGRFDIASTTVTATIPQSTSILQAQMSAYPVNSKVWHSITGGFAEFDLGTMADVRTVLWADVVNMYHLTTGMGRYIYLPSINCLHMSHGTISAVSPLGGVDKVCLPCPPTPIASVSQQLFLSQNLAGQQSQRGPSIVPSLP